MNWILKKIKKVPRVVRKVFSGESVLILERDKEHWDGQFERGKWDFLLTRPQYHISLIAGYVRKLGEQRPGLSVLDVGCGNGALARELDLDKLSYTGTDISEVAVAQAKETAPGGKFICLSMTEDLPTKEQFDVLIFCEVLLYGEYKEVLKRYQKYLKKDGFIIVSLYGSWRTSIIWRQINRYLHVVDQATVKDGVAGTRWCIKIARLNEI